MHTQIYIYKYIYIYKLTVLPNILHAGVRTSLSRDFAGSYCPGPGSCGMHCMSMCAYMYEGLPHACCSIYAYMYKGPCVLCVCVCVHMHMCTCRSEADVLLHGDQMKIDNCASSA